jgi:cation transport regulator ChaC
VHRIDRSFLERDGVRNAVRAAGCAVVAARDGAGHLHAALDQRGYRRRHRACGGFRGNRSKPGYAGRLSEEEIVATTFKARGHFGACADYLVSTAASLEQHGIADRRLSRLAKLLLERRDGGR